MSAGRTVNSKSQSWGTPPKYVNVIRKFFDGSVALDPCSNEYSIVHAETEFMLPENDGLKEEWNYLDNPAQTLPPIPMIPCH